MQALVCISAALALAACAVSALQQRASIPAMKPSITYLHLLRHTPFFTELDTDQLRWVIQHSREWEVQPGTLLVSDALAGERAGYWVLLDGGWTLDYRGRAHSSGHADPGKWFEAGQLPGTFALSANAHSYVMHIATSDMQGMLARGFNFEQHLAQGQDFYRELSASRSSALR
ncbi:hypothetical protein MBN93_003989 [Klebsiella pneumoniae]|nr:hypothetical protein [Klebsiella pneumoniae]